MDKYSTREEARVDMLKNRGFSPLTPQGSLSGVLYIETSKGREIWESMSHSPWYRFDKAIAPPTHEEMNLRL